MTFIKHVAFTLVLMICSALLCVAQTPRVSTVNVKAEADRVHISAEGDVSEMRVDVADESGDVVFQSGAITG